MTAQSHNETEHLSHANRKKVLLNEARADALRANLKKRKEQMSARKNDNPTETIEETITV